MKISAIIPTLNAERWITQQLNMLLSQTVEAEIIVADSGSSDGTPGLVRRFAPRVRLWDKEPSPCPVSPCPVSSADPTPGFSRNRLLPQYTVFP